jgi:hypothetical protein
MVSTGLPPHTGQRYARRPFSRSLPLAPSARSGSQLCCPGLFLTLSVAGPRARSRALVTSSRRAAPGPPRRGLVGPDLARPRGGAGRGGRPDGGRSGRSAVPSAAQQQKDLDGRRRPGAATGGPEPAPRPRPGTPSKAQPGPPQLPQQPRAAPACPRRAGGAFPACIPPRLGPRKCGWGGGRFATRLPACRRGAHRGGRPGPAEPGRWAAVGCLVSASSPEPGLFSWPQRNPPPPPFLLLLLAPFPSLLSSSCT